MMHDGTCLIATSMVGSPVVELYEVYLSASSHDCEFSRNPLCFSLPIHSIHLSHQALPLDPMRWPVSLKVQVVNPVLGIGVHFYNLIRQPLALAPGNYSQHKSCSKLKVRFVRSGTCAISLPPNAPRILAAIPLDNENFISRNPQLTNNGAQLLLVILSNGQVNLAQSSKNTRLLSSTPFILPDNILDVLQIPGPMIQIAMTLHSRFNKPEHMSCSIIVRPLTSTGQIFVTEVPLDGLLAPPVISNLQSRLLPIKTVPYGFTPLFTPISHDSHEQARFTGVVVTTSPQDEGTKYVCLVDEAVPKYSLLAYDAVARTDCSIGEVEAAGCFQNNFCYSPSNSVNSITTVLRSTSSLLSHVGQTGVFISCLDSNIHTSVQALSLKKIGLTGFIKSERPKTLIINLLDASKTNTVRGMNSILCLTSSNRLTLWSVPDGVDDWESLINLTHEIALPDTLLSNTLTLSGSPSPLILALDTDTQLFRSTLIENFHDSKLELKKVSSHPIGAKDTLNLTNSRSQSVVLEVHESRFIAMLWLSCHTNQTQIYRLIILDLKQQPYSAGIVGLDDFEIIKDCNHHIPSTPQLRWSEYQKSSNLLNYCFLAVCCGNNVARVYSRDGDGWWRKTWDLHSRFGPIFQMTWIARSNGSIPLYQVAGHTLAGSPITTPSRIDLPPWHPTVLKNKFLFGNITLVSAIVSCLSLALKGIIEPLTLLSEMILSSYLFEENTSHIEKLNECASNLIVPDGMSPTTLSSIHIDVITSAVNKRQIPLLSENEQLTLLDLSKTFLQVQTARSHGIDLYGCQYIFSLTNYLKNYSGIDSDVLGLDSSQDCGILMAQLSTTQSLLAHETCAILQKQFNNTVQSEFNLDWHTSKSIGLFLWLQDQDQFKIFLEKVAQVEYITGGKNDNNKIKDPKMNGTQEQDPASCSLFYMALKKKRLLLGLWKVAYGHSDRNLMVKFLQNDFSQERWKTVAQKNAFALLSRQRFAFAASFFLLADRLQDAVNICIQRLSDWQLAIAICRAYEGDAGPVLKKLIKEIVLPVGFSNVNRWLISWCYNMLAEVDLACKILTAPWDELLKLQTSSLSSSVECRAVRVGPLDLSLVLLFNQLKVNCSTSMTWQDEKTLILLVIEELINSGCNSLASILVKNWNFNRMIVRDKVDHQKGRSNQINQGEDDSKQDSSDIKSMHAGSGTTQPQFNQPDQPHQQLPAVKNRVLSQPVIPEFDMSQFF